jgi:hypothetical protein
MCEEDEKVHMSVAGRVSRRLHGGCNAIKLIGLGALSFWREGRKRKRERERQRERESLCVCVCVCVCVSVCVCVLLPILPDAQQQVQFLLLCTVILHACTGSGSVAPFCDVLPGQPWRRSDCGKMNPQRTSRNQPCRGGN